ncbi:MAG: hypothetical protein EU536_04810 [Promethearchaeota archaeon]|nr:MAG: hypothetical protein EU536_04810 [Candidatus Lokiarchaeota archaeon]
MLRAYCYELKEDVLSFQAPANHADLTFFCPHCQHRVTLVVKQRGERTLAYWKHVIANRDCPILRKERGEFPEYPTKEVPSDE